MTDRTTAEYQRAVDAYVRQHVLAGASTLIYELCQMDSEEVREQIYEAGILSQPDYEGSAWDQGWRENDDGDGFHNINDEDETSEADDWEELCQENDIEPDYREAYEHWIVDDVLEHHLRKRGEMVGEVFGLTIWGRCTTGQSIALDSVICDIYDDFNRRQAA